LVKRKGFLAIGDPIYYSKQIERNKDVDFYSFYQSTISLKTLYWLR